MKVERKLFVCVLRSSMKFTRRIYVCAQTSKQKPFTRTVCPRIEKHNNQQLCKYRVIVQQLEQITDGIIEIATFKIKN